MALTQSQMVAAVADRADLSRADAKRALDALDEIVLEELGNAQKVRLGGLVQLTVRVKPATKKRPGRNPATGEEITIAAKPASVDVRARPWQRPRRRFRRCRRRGGGLRRQTDAARDSARSPRSAAERQARQTSLAWTSPANAQLRRHRAASPTPAPLSRPTIRDGRLGGRPLLLRRVAVRTSGRPAVAPPNAQRTRPQQSRARRWRRHRPRQFSHPRIAVRIRQSPASLPAVVQPREGDWQAPLRPHRRHQRRTRVRAQHNSELSGNRGRRPDDAVRLEIGEQQFVASGRDETASMPAQVSRATRVVTARVRQQQRDRRRRCCRSGAC